MLASRFHLFLFFSIVYTATQLSSLSDIHHVFAGKCDHDLTEALRCIRVTERDSFIRGIQHDVAEATRCAESAGLKFDDTLTAVYHYRKHGAEFPKAITKYGNRIDVYLGPVRDRVFNQSNLREVCTLEVCYKQFIIIIITTIIILRRYIYVPIAEGTQTH